MDSSEQGRLIEKDPFKTVAICGVTSNTEILVEIRVLVSGRRVAVEVVAEKLVVVLLRHKWCSAGFS